MKRFIILAILFGSSIAAAETKPAESGPDSVQDLMITSKFAGMCGTIKQMASFQESTKMPGGDDFLLRFLATEQARLGMTPQEFLKVCQSSISTYTTYYNMKLDQD